MNYFQYVNKNGGRGEISHFIWQIFVENCRIHIWTGKLFFLQWVKCKMGLYVRTDRQNDLQQLL